MLDVIGLERVEDLFAALPAKLRLAGPLRVPEGLSELEVQTELERLAARNDHAGRLGWFLGAGTYPHFVPSAVDALVSRAEFGWLVFPDHIYAAPPYELDPAVFWLQLVAGSAKGSARVLERVGGRPLAYAGLECQRDTLQLRQGPATLWGPCTIRYRDGDSTVARRLFASIIERDGAGKFLGYANEF